MVSSIWSCTRFQRASFLAGLCLAISFICVTPAHAADEAVLDSASLSHLEAQAANAQFKEQCFLYTEILHNLTEIAGKQLADGQDEQASATLKHIDSVAAKVQMALAKDAKRLKNAEKLLEHTTHRLADMMHITAGDQREVLQETLARVNTVHSLLLSQVFAQ